MLLRFDGLGVFLSGLGFYCGVNSGEDGVGEVRSFFEFF